MQQKTAEFQSDKLEFIKSPVVAEFLQLKPNSDFTETKLEKAIIAHLKELNHHHNASRHWTDGYVYPYV